jgi:uncharacterized protein (TIGR02284 family)
MAIDNEYVISTLNNLIETCKDGQQGFRTAADGVESSELKTLFHAYAQQRGQFAAELQAEVRRLGGDPEQVGSIGGALHHGWINIKSAVTGKDEAAVLSECERGEDAAVRNYEEALRGELPADIHPIIERQAKQVRDAHDQLRNLERGAGAAGA